MDMILPNYAGLFGLSGNIDDRRPQGGSPYGILAGQPMINAQIAASQPQVPTYQPMNPMRPGMLPGPMSQGSAYTQSGGGGPFQPGGMGIGVSVPPQNQRIDPSWFTPAPQPPPIQNMSPTVPNWANTGEVQPVIPMMLGLGM
jgi:hypothetical protein